MVEGTLATIDANEAVASVAYRLSEVVAIYPITPASPMGEHADEWSVGRAAEPVGHGPRRGRDAVRGRRGRRGARGAAGRCAGHDVHRVAGPAADAARTCSRSPASSRRCCMHVAARSVATHALSIFGDHSDVMAARGTGLRAAGVGVAAGGAGPRRHRACGDAARRGCRSCTSSTGSAPRTRSRRSSTVDDAVLDALVDDDAVAAHRARALSPDRPVVRGTVAEPRHVLPGPRGRQSVPRRLPDDAWPTTMARFAELTGRRYRLFDYVGHPEAERVVVMMGSGAECAHEIVDAPRRRAASGSGW